MSNTWSSSTLFDHKLQYFQFSIIYQSNVLVDIITKQTRVQLSSTFSFIIKKKLKCIPEHRVHFLLHFYDLYFKLKCIHGDILQNRIINVPWIQIDSFKTINIFCIKCNKHQLFDYKWLFLYICYVKFFFEISRGCHYWVRGWFTMLGRHAFLELFSEKNI